MAGEEVGGGEGGRGGGGEGGRGRVSVASWVTVVGLARASDGLLGGVLRERGERERERERRERRGERG